MQKNTISITIFIYMMIIIVKLVTMLKAIIKTVVLVVVLQQLVVLRNCITTNTSPSTINISPSAITNTSPSQHSRPFARKKSTFVCTST